MPRPGCGDPGFQGTGRTHRHANRGSHTRVQGSGLGRASGGGRRYRDETGGLQVQSSRFSVSPGQPSRQRRARLRRKGWTLNGDRTSFIFFLGATTWERCLDHLSLSHGLRCARLLLAAQPWVCLALLAVPPVALFLLSARYRLAARLSFCSIPAVLLVVTCLAAAPLLELQQAYLNLDGIVRVLEEETTRTSATGETGGGGNDSLPGARPGGGL